MPAPKSTTPDPEFPDEGDVDLDLLANDARYREALAKPARVRLPTGKIITVPPMADWPHLGTRMVSMGLFDAWAEAVLSEDDFPKFKAAGLHNYQIEKITDAASAAAGTTPGKRRPSSS
jgi:hypothetical protein